MLGDSSPLPFPDTDMLILTPPLLLLLIASLCDLRSREIPDLLPLLILGWALSCRLVPLDGVSWLDTAIGLGVGFGFPAALFYAGGLGGGDVKLLGALGALVGWPAVGTLLIATGLAGGVLAIAVVLRRRATASDAEAADEVEPPTPADLPYALAIAAGFGLTWWRGDWPVPTELLT